MRSLWRHGIAGTPINGLQESRMSGSRSGKRQRDEGTMIRPPYRHLTFAVSVATTAIILCIASAESRALEKRNFNRFGLPAWMPPQKKESSIPIDENLLTLLTNYHSPSGETYRQKQLLSYLLEMQRRGHDVKNIQRKAISSLTTNAGNHEKGSRALHGDEDTPRVRFLRVY